jgi:hypothetical protein
MACPSVEPRPIPSGLLAAVAMQSQPRRRLKRRMRRIASRRASDSTSFPDHARQNPAGLSPRPACAHDPAARWRPSCPIDRPLRERRGRRECRELAAPMAACKKHAVVTTGSAETPAFPARWCYGCFAISPVRRACWPPSVVGPIEPFDLDTSVEVSGPRDLTVRLRHVRRAHRQRPPPPCPTYRDDRPKRPSSSRQDGREDRGDLPDNASEMACDKVTRRAVCAWWDVRMLVGRVAVRALLTPHLLI